MWASGYISGLAIQGLLIQSFASRVILRDDLLLIDVEPKVQSSTGQ